MAKIFLGYATRSSAARDVATSIAKVLRERGHRTVIADLATKPRIDQADLVVVGSGIQTGAWYPEAVSWLTAHAAELQSVDVAIYNTCLNAANPEKRDEALSYNRDAVEVSGADMQESFPGRYIPEKVGPLQRLLLLVMRKKRSDHFDHDAVHAWATSLAGRLD